MRVEEIHRLEINKMRILRMMFGKTLKDRIKNECIRGITKVESFILKLCEGNEGHMERMRQMKHLTW